jgi:hypothetical protein
MATVGQPLSSTDNKISRLSSVPESKAFRCGYLSLSSSKRRKKIRKLIHFVLNRILYFNPNPLW